MRRLIAMHLRSRVISPAFIITFIMLLSHSCRQYSLELDLFP